MAAKENKKKKNKESKTVSIFLITFIVTFAFVALSVKYFSPEIDVEIEGKEQIAEEDVEKGSVDERLRWIQFEDNMPGVSTRFTEETENTQKTKNDDVNEFLFEYTSRIPVKDIQKAMKNYKDSVIVEEINVVEQDKKAKKYSKAAIKEFDITLVPALVFINKEGKTIKKHQSLMKANEIIEVLDGIK